MKDEYDLSKMQSRKNPYSAELKYSVSVDLNEDIVKYFRDIEKKAHISYQKLIQLYLRDCVAQHRKIHLNLYGADS